MVNYLTMIKVNVFEAKAKLSHYLDLLRQGERVVICRRNHPVAELVAIAAARTKSRPIGLATSLTVPAAFFEPLPDDVVDTFYPAHTERARPRANRVAERSEASRKRPTGRRTS